MTPEGTPRDTGARLERAETREWLESPTTCIAGTARARPGGSSALRDHAYRTGVQPGLAVTTPHAPALAISVPGRLALER
jgi:hypothetical protein